MQETPLTPWHRQHGAKMAEFAGYDMPIEYTRLLDEHRQVRTGAGIFDVSHMTEFRVTGSDATRFVDRLVTNWPSRLERGQVLYTPMCYPDGGTVDDLLVYRVGDQEYLLVANAANHSGDWAWIQQAARQEAAQVDLVDESDRTALIALQGPKAPGILEQVVDVSDRPTVTSLVYYHFATGIKVGEATALISRTGYTGEDGFEIYLPASAALAVWESLVEAGAVPIGLGARDTLRLEARLPLYGHELSPAINPLEAGLSGFVKWDKPNGFIGREALFAIKEAGGPARRLVGIKPEGGIARAGYSLGKDGETGGVVTSGTYSPTLEAPIALALVPRGWGSVGTELWVEIRGRRVPARVVKLPFYRREA